MRLFASPVFTVCCVLSFVVGFAMLGALTFLPTYMQFVDGVSATDVGPAHAADGGRDALTSIGSGVLVGRTGRYKIFPVAGTAVMALAFLLLSRMDAVTRHWLQSVYLFILGAGIGSVHAGAGADRAEHVELRRPRRRHLGRDVLPHHRQFVRRGDLRLAVHQLPRTAGSARRWPRAVRHRQPRSRRRRCTGCHRAVAAPIVERLRRLADKVFLCAVPVALVGFVVWRCSSARFRCAISAPTPPTSVTDSRCRPRRLRRICWKPRSGA